MVISLVLELTVDSSPVALMVQTNTVASLIRESISRGGVQVAISPTVLSKDGTSGESGRLEDVSFTDEVNAGEIDVDEPPPFNIFVSTGTSRNHMSVPRTMDHSQRRSVAALQ